MSSASFAAPEIGPDHRSRSGETGDPSRASGGAARPPSGEHRLSLRPKRLSLASRRMADILLSSLALFVLSPAMAVIALLIKATSRGPVLYRQTRVGQNRRWLARRESGPATGPDRRTCDRRTGDDHGCPFNIIKFRTMVVNAEEYGPQWSSENDPRITAVGRVLRKTRLDEIPQFWNVLRGDMAIIGPRPERPFFVSQFVEDVPQYGRRLRVRPGITGQAQVTLDYDSSVDDVAKKVEQDIDYVENRSMLRDLRILLKTVAVVLTGKGAR